MTGVRIAAKELNRRLRRYLRNHHPNLSQRQRLSSMASRVYGFPAPAGLRITEAGASGFPSMVKMTSISKSASWAAKNLRSEKLLLHRLNCRSLKAKSSADTVLRKKRSPIVYTVSFTSTQLFHCSRRYSSISATVPNGRLQCLIILA